MIKVGLVGFGKAGQAVAHVLHEDPRYELRWIARRSASAAVQISPEVSIPVAALTSADDWRDWLDAHPVDAVVDFSNPEGLHLYGEALRTRHIMLVSAISAYSPADLAYRHPRDVLAKHHRRHQFFDHGGAFIAQDCAICRCRNHRAALSRKIRSIRHRAQDRSKHGGGRRPHHLAAPGWHCGSP